jgi:hypothetical protein
MATYWALLHLSLELLVKGLQLVHFRGLSGPADAHAFLLVGLGDLLHVSKCLLKWEARADRETDRMRSTMYFEVTYHVEVNLIQDC